MYMYMIIYMYRPRARDGGPPPPGENHKDRTLQLYPRLYPRYYPIPKRFISEILYPRYSLSKFPNLISFDPSNYHFFLAGKFEKAVAAAEKAADDFQKTLTAQRAART
jgi:hypothetical protein